MGKLFFAAAAMTLMWAAAAQAMPGPEPLAVVAPVKAEPVTAVAHLTYRDPKLHALIESSLMMVGEAPAFAQSGCRMRDTAQDAAPGALKAPTVNPPAPLALDGTDGVRPKDRWVVCS
jgi:hypothetical protein